MKKIFILLVISYLSFNLNYAYSQYQCPPDDYGYLPHEATESWQFGGCYILPLTIDLETCDYLVCYCWRNAGATMPMIEIYITSVTLASQPCNHDQHATKAQIDATAAYEVIARNPGNHNWPCPPCPYETANYRAYLAPCYDQMWQACPNNWDAMCVTSYILCCDNMGMRYISETAHFSSGECSGDPECNIQCPDITP